MNNLMHFKYAAEVEKTGSISKAAENLYMGQPQLSRAIRDLEDSLGIAVFNRTSKGVVPTERGSEFLTYAKNILRQMDEIESLYKSGNSSHQRFDLTSPRASYISRAFCDFVRTLDPEKQLSVNYRETNSAASIEYVAQSMHNLAIIRYQTAYEQYFLNALSENDLKYDLILEFDHMAIFSETHPLAAKTILDAQDLENCIEIVHGDISVPSLPTIEARKIANDQKTKKTIAVYERASQFELLSRVPNTYMWVAPVPRDLLSQYHLVARPCNTCQNHCKDLLISRKGYHFSNEDKKFIEILKHTVSAIC